MSKVMSEVSLINRYWDIFKWAFKLLSEAYEGNSFYKHLNFNLFLIMCFASREKKDV